MNHPKDVDNSPDDPLKPSISLSSTPSAHPSMHSEHPDPTRYTCDDLGSSVYFTPDAVPFFSPPLPLFGSPSLSEHDRVLSNLSGSSDAICPDNVRASLADKGKTKEPPPTLPPLSFSPAGLGHNIDDWSSIPGPSSYRSTCASLHTASPASIESTTTQVDEPPTLTKVPSRTRSLSDLSVHSTTPSMSKIKIKLAASSKAPVNLARRLLSRNKADVAGPAVTSPYGLADPLGNDLLPIDSGNCLFPWQSKDFTQTPVSRVGVETHDAPVVASDIVTAWYSDHYQLGITDSRGKGRSYSSPFPISAFDVVPRVDFEDNVMPLLSHARDLFDEMLPRELRLRVFSSLISLHEADHERLKSSGKWSISAASSSKNRWVGQNRGIRELVKLSRVSKMWRALVFDGQLWQNVNLQAFPASSAGFLASLVQLSGPFVKNLDLSGHTQLSQTVLIDIAGGLCVRFAPIANFTYTQLTTIALQGCTSLTTKSLHSLLVRSPFLRSLNVKGLQAVTNATFDVLALCLHLTSLNVSRCANIDGDGVCAFAGAVIARGARLALKELRLCGLSMVNDDTLATLGKAAPHLEILDLSYCRSLHNSALEAFVSCTEDEKDCGETILLSARQAGRDPRDWSQYRRRVTALRHLSLSECTMLTDTACSNLAYSVPHLEFLELAGIGKTLKDDGIVHLLGTTPFIRRLDLEDAHEITDAVLEAVTPEPAVEEENSMSSKRTNFPQPGHALEHLTVSAVPNLTNGAFRALISNCPRLRVLEADGTPLSGTMLKEFVRQVRERGIDNAGLVAVDCHLVGERFVKDVIADTRPRKGWRSWEARKLGYLDSRDGEELKVGQDECDEKRVAIKTFYGWETVNAVRRARERKKKATKKARSTSGHASEPEEDVKLPGKARWWAPNSRTSSGNSTPGEDNDRDGCVVM